MFIVYYSNQLEKQKEILSSLFKSLPPEDPFQQDIILVQSPNMAQWLQIELAKETGISANLKFLCQPVLYGNFMHKIYPQRH